jgi:multidrug resistance efflux pump
MSEIEKIDFKPLEIPKVRRGYLGLLKIAAALVAVAAAGWAWSAGYRPPFLAKEKQQSLQLIEIDRGDINLVVTEMGTIESSNNRTIRCTVEALLGQVGGAQGMGTGKAAGGMGGQGAGGAGGQGASGAGGAGGAQDASQATTTKAKTATKKVGATSSATGTATTGSTSSTSSTTSTTGSSSSSASTTGTSGSSSSSGTTSSSTSSGSTSTSSTVAKKPVIRSFTYVVPKYVPLRPVTAKVPDAAAQKKAQQQQMMAQQGGGGGGRGRGRGGRGGRGGMMEEEKPGATTIVEIVPEGTRVKAGDVVCRLDSSAFEDEERAQRIRHIQAKSYVEQANAILEVNQITLREYRDGIYPQDLELVRQYIATCQLEKDRLERAAIWSRDMGTKGYRTKYQIKGDELALEQAQIALSEALNMLNRLNKQTGPKIKTALEANVEAIKADKFTQDASFSLESQRLERLQKNIKNCTLVAPSEGIVVYANDTNQWGQVTAPIDQGVTVRQDQPIINLPDPLHMRVKARINESKLALVHTGQRARIVIDAYSDRPLKGRVAEITPINVPLNASDVRVYYANVDIESGFDELRPGLSAEVSFMIDSRHDVRRIPLEAIRWIGEQGYAAVQDSTPGPDGKPSFKWRRIQLGMSDTRYAEVLSGLEAGDRVIARPRSLDPPAPEPVRPSPTNVAELTP